MAECKDNVMNVSPMQFERNAMQLGYDELLKPRG
jgi:hypothetical protein